MSQPSAEDGASPAPRTARAWFRFSGIATLVGIVWLGLAGLIAVDGSDRLIASLDSQELPTLVIGLLTVSLQPRGRWLALVGVLGVNLALGYLLTSSGFMDIRSPLPAPGPLTILGLGVLLGVSLAAVGVGLPSRFSPAASLVALAWLGLVGLIDLDVSVAADPSLGGMLQLFWPQLLAVGLLTLGLQPRDRWLASVGMLGILFAGVYVLLATGVGHSGSPLPSPRLLEVIGFGAFLLASLAAVGVGLVRRSPATA